MYDFLAPEHKAVWLGESNESYTQGQEYLVHIQKMSDGRLAVFKTLHHFREPEGYMVVKKNELETKFKLND